MKNTLINRSIIKRVAGALGEMNDQVIYVGGATVSLYIDDPAAEDIRPTKDIDISINIASLSHLEEIRKILVKKGFRQTADLDVICRFKYDDILLDVMGTKAVGWAPANPWFHSGFDQRETIEIDGYQVQIMPLPYFLASKFAAHNDRGGDDPRMSKDFEDITYILNNRTDWHEIVQKSEDEVRNYLISQFKSILNSSALKEAILGNLFWEFRQERFDAIIVKIKELLG